MITNTNPHSLETQFLQPSFYGRIDDFADFVAGLPTSVAAIRDAIQNLFIHQMWLEAYGLPPEPRHGRERELRTVEEYLQAAVQLTGKSLGEPRPPPERVSCICRDFTLIFTTLLRLKGIPARSRCGFASYFECGKWTDHWITEYRDAATGQWLQGDAQLDALQLSTMPAGFNPLALAKGDFLTAGEVWERVQDGSILAKNCGILEYWGAHFVFGSVFQDCLSCRLNMELKPWDLRRALSEAYNVTGSEMGILEQVIKSVVSRTLPSGLV